MSIAVTLLAGSESPISHFLFPLRTLKCNSPTAIYPSARSFAEASFIGGPQLELSQAKSPKSATARRSQRLLLAVNVVISGKQVTGAPFAEETVTQVVNAHGALVLLKQTVLKGDRLKLSNLRTGEEIGCKVVDVSEQQGRKSAVGIEFDQPSPRFWRISFPPEDWTPRSAEAKRPSISPRVHPQTDGTQPHAKK